MCVYIFALFIFTCRFYAASSLISSLCGVTILCDVASRSYVLMAECVNATCCCLSIVKWLLTLAIQHEKLRQLCVYTSVHNIPLCMWCPCCEK